MFMLNSDELGRLSDRDLLAESRVFEGYITANAAELNLTAADGDEVKTINNDFEATLDQWDSIQAQEAGISETKKDERGDVLGIIRRKRNVLYADESVTDSQRAGANMPPRDTVKTDSPAPSSAPIGWVDYGKLKQTIHFRDSATPDSKAKPKGMRGAEIWEFIGDAPPTSEADFRYVATDTNSPYDRYFTMADAGKRIFYQLRWISNAGETGEWSEMIEGTING